MTDRPITDYHAHIYFTPGTRPVAERLRAGLAERFPTARLGRWHDVPVGPHTEAMYQVLFTPDLFATLTPYLMLHREGLAILLHPDTGDDLADHTAHAVWFGEILPLKLDVLRKAD